MCKLVRSASGFRFIDCGKSPVWALALKIFGFSRALNLATSTRLNALR